MTQRDASAHFEEIVDDPVPPKGEANGKEGGSGRAGPPDRSDFLVTAWRKLNLPPRDYLLQNLMCSTSRWEIIGETGVGKTLFCLELAFAIAMGANFLNWQGVRPCRVMYLDGELPAETLKERIESAAKLFGEPQLYAYNRDRLTDTDLPPLNTPNGQKWLLAEIDAVKPDLIVFDNVMSLLIGKMADEESWTPVVPFTRQLTARRIAQIWVHHTGHDTTHGFGSKTREWQMDTVAILTREGAEEETSIRLEFTKARLRTPTTAALFKPLVIKRDDHGWTAQPTTSKRRENVAEHKQHWFAEAYDFLANDVVAAPGPYTRKPIRKVSIDRIRALMQEREQLTAENGKLPEKERTAFKRAKEHFIAARIMTAKDGFIWRI